MLFKEESNIFVLLKKEFTYIVIAFLLFGFKCADELYRPPFSYVVSFQTGIQNTTDEYKSVYTVKKNDTNSNSQTNRFALYTDSLHFLIPPDYYTDSIYLCFEHINTTIDTVGLCYKRKLFIKREYSKQAFDMDVYDSKIFYLSNSFDKDSSIINSDNTSTYNGNINIRIYKK
jgi:hypothetical protein